MSIAKGDTLPSVVVQIMGADGGPENLATDEFFKGRKVVVFGLPGAFTPTCSTRHVPGYLANADTIKAKGVDEIACVSVNDAFVMDAWARDLGVGGRITMLADGSAKLTKAIGLDQDRTEAGMGIRSKRYALVVEDGVATLVNVEEGRNFDVSSAERILAAL
jgi:peroxiredoxin